MGDRNAAEAFLIPLFFSLQQTGQALHHIVDIHQLKSGIPPVYLDGKTMGNVMAEGGYGAVIVGTAPFSEHVGETVNINGDPVFLSISRQKFFPLPLADPVGIVKLRLDGGREHHRAMVSMLFQKR